MAHILFVRHGRSVSNNAGVFSGGTDDAPLVDEGRRQALIAGRNLKSHQNIRRLIASPLSRTLETAQIIAGQIGFDIEQIEIDVRLKEYGVGEGQGQPIAGMTAKRLVSFAGAENPNEFAKRVREALRDAQVGDGVSLIVSHNGVGRIIEAMRQGIDSAEFYAIDGYPNAEAVELDLTWLRDEDH